MRRNLGARPLLGLEPAVVAEEPTEARVRDDDLDAEALVAVVEPLAHLGDPREERREAEPDPAFVEALLAGAEADPALLVDRRMQVDGEVLVRAEVVDAAA